VLASSRVDVDPKAVATHKFRPINHGSHDVLRAPNALVELPSLELPVGGGHGDLRSSVLRGAVGRHSEETSGLEMERVPQPPGE
jgi:hypothetical protein